jgi:hypothetical protein
VRHYCIVPGCDHPGRHALTLRVRRPDSSAIIAPNTGAYLCDEHAESGFEMDIAIKPNDSRKAEIFTWAERAGVQGHVERAVTLIENPAAKPEGKAGDQKGVTRRITRPAAQR